MTRNCTQVKIVKPAFGGFGLGYMEGKAVLVRYAIPGDRVSITINREKRDYIIADIEKVLESAECRIKPECNNFSLCGGCCYLNVPYHEEITLKRDILIDSLRRIGGLDEFHIPEIQICSSNRFHYRSHAAIKVQNESRGFYRQGSNDLVPFPSEGCLLLDQRITGHLSEENGILKVKEFRIAVGSDSGIVSSLDSDPVLTEETGGLTFHRHVDTFFQVNSFLREDMLGWVDDFAGLEDGETVLDIGCGVGFFTLFLANRASRSTGVDISRKSIQWAMSNAELNGIKNARFLCLPASEINPGQINSASVIVVDPPRAGLSRRDRNTIVSLGAERIVYVSCNPATFSRDMADLLKNGYRLSHLALLDMFPATHHIEVISRLIRK